MSIKHIETLRLKLIETAKKYGMNSMKTIQCSQELDTLLIEEMRMKREAMKKAND